MTYFTPNLPALIAAIPGDHTRAPQTEFTRARQVLFVENLSVTGSVRSAASAAGVSHQSAYRARRSCGHLRLAWDAALVAARVAAADTLAVRAIDGVEEEVFYHGEVIGSRRRYSDRLLLAHLARLDRLVEDAGASAFAEHWDAAMARFANGEEPVVRASSQTAHAEPVSLGDSFASEAPSAQDQTVDPAGQLRDRQAQGERRGNGADNLSPGPCNKWSMSPAAPPGVPPAEAADEDGEEIGDRDYDRHDDEDVDDDEDDDMGTAEDYADLLQGESQRHARLPLIDRLIASMHRRRPAEAPAIPNRWGSQLEYAQLEAYMARLDEWWLVIPPGATHPAGEWCFYEADPDERERAS